MKIFLILYLFLNFVIRVYGLVFKGEDRINMSLRFEVIKLFNIIIEILFFLCNFVINCFYVMEMI